MFERYEERFDQLNLFPSTMESYNIEELASFAEDTVAYRDRSLFTIALHRPGHRTLAYETIDLGHMTWFEALAMSPKELGKLNGSSECSWKVIHSRKYAYDTIYGFEPQGVDMYLEKLIKENTEWEERQTDRFLGETARVRDVWVYVYEDDAMEVNDRDNLW